MNSFESCQDLYKDIDLSLWENKILNFISTNLPKRLPEQFANVVISNRNIFINDEEIKQSSIIFMLQSIKIKIFVVKNPKLINDYSNSFIYFLDVFLETLEQEIPQIVPYLENCYPGTSFDISDDDIYSASDPEFFEDVFSSSSLTKDIHIHLDGSFRTTPSKDLPSFDSF